MYLSHFLHALNKKVKNIMISMAFHIMDVCHPQNKLGKPEWTSTTESKQKKQIPNTSYL